MVFFSKNKKTALARLKQIGETDKTVRLAKKQIPHISNWKTWEIINKKK